VAVKPRRVTFSAENGKAHSRLRLYSSRFVRPASHAEAFSLHSFGPGTAEAGGLRAGLGCAPLAHG
jgi:hypothetical protein